MATRCEGSAWALILGGGDFGAENLCGAQEETGSERVAKSPNNGALTAFPVFCGQISQAKDFTSPAKTFGGGGAQTPNFSNELILWRTILSSFWGPRFSHHGCVTPSRFAGR